jgi:hypothetical protein
MMHWTGKAEKDGSWSNNELTLASYYRKAEHIVSRIRLHGVYDPDVIKVAEDIKVITKHTKARSIAQVSHHAVSIHDVEFCCHHIPMFLTKMSDLDLTLVNVEEEKWRDLTSKIRADLRKEGMQCHDVGKTPLPWQKQINNNPIPGAINTDKDAKTGQSKRAAAVAMANSDKTAGATGPNKRHNSSSANSSETTGEEGVQPNNGGLMGKLVAATKGACLGAYNGFAGNSNSNSS